ncbi:MAG: LysM peptidoglycan-binding domain-containing protein [Nevskiales bacterium]
MKRFRSLLLLGLLTLCVPGRPQAAVADFPRPATLEPRVTFWRQIFVEYSEYQLVLHDAQYPWKVIKVLDFRLLKQGGTSPATMAQTMNAAEKRERILIDRMFGRLHEKRDHPESLSADERRLWKLYGDLRAANRFLAARGRVRAQRGLREHFSKAITVSGRYLPHMEKTFRDAGLPIELTRLPFVESSFNVEAYSKVGAAGIWQFMPSTAREYMRLNELVDDRRDPLFSTEAAARHLAEDYRALKSWPMAVTAYNHGRGGLVKGMKQLGTRNLVDLIQRYDSPNFGFASRNFYASFLAALDAHRDYRRYLGEVPVERPLVFSEFTTRHYVNYHALQRISGLTPEKFRLFNPAYHPQVMEGKLLVPPRHRIRIPAGTRQIFSARYSTLGPNELAYAQKRYYHEHKIARGQSLGGIARHYGVNVRDIQAANNLGAKTRIRVGQLLKIPPRSESKPVASGVKPAPGSSPARAAASARPSGLSHRVTQGQTLEVIARRYHTTVKAIMAANNLKDPRRLRAGQVLVIPQG